MIYYPTVMARYSLFVLKVPLNPKQTNSPENVLMLILVSKVVFLVLDGIVYLKSLVPTSGNIVD